MDRAHSTTIAQEHERYAQQKAALSSQGQIGGLSSGSRGSANALKPPHNKKVLSSYDHHEHR